MLHYAASDWNWTNISGIITSSSCHTPSIAWLNKDLAPKHQQITHSLDTIQLICCKRGEIIARMKVKLAEDFLTFWQNFAPNTFTPRLLQVRNGSKCST